MSLTKNDLSAIAQIVKESISGLETDVASIKNDVTRLQEEVKYIKLVQLENNVIPRLNTIESCYLDTYDRYKNNNDKFEAALSDIDVMKLAIRANSADILELKKMQQT